MSEPQLITKSSREAPKLNGYSFFCLISPTFSGDDKSGKGPFAKEWQRNPLRAWPVDYPHNVGVCLGHAHDDGYLVVVDVDNAQRLTPDLVDALGQAPTYTVKTAKGYHFYYLVDFEPGDAAFPGGDIKGAGQVVAPGSLHFTGFTYTCVDQRPFAKLPEAWRMYVPARGERAQKAASSCPQTRVLTGEDLRQYAQRNWLPNHPQYQLLLNIAAGRSVGKDHERHIPLELNLTKALVGEFGPEITDESVIALLAPSYPNPMPEGSRRAILSSLEGARLLKLAERAACPVPALPAPVPHVSLTPIDFSDASRKLTKRADAWRKEILRALSNRAPVADQTEAARAVLLSVGKPVTDQAILEWLPQADVPAARAQVAQVAAQAEAAAKAALAKAEAKARAEERKQARIEKTVASLSAQGLELELDEDGDVPSTPVNVKRILDATIKGFKDRRTGDLKVRVPWAPAELDVSDASASTIKAAAWYQEKFGIQINYPVIERMLTEAAREQTRDLIQENAATFQWDGIERLATAGDVLVGREDPFARAWLQSFLFGVAERVLRPGCEMDRVWLLKGGQKSGKTSLFDEVSRLLTGQKCWRMVSGKDDDFRKRHMGVIALDDEMTAYSQVGSGEYKSWISTDSTLIRAPYARAAERTACGFVYGATCNMGQILNDPTGARRFVVLELAGSDRNEAARYDQPRLFAMLPQLLAEALATAEAGSAEAVLADAKQAVQVSQDDAQYVSETQAQLAEAFAAPDEIASVRLMVPKNEPVRVPLGNAQLDAFLGIQGPRTRQQSRDVRDAMTALGWVYKQMWLNGRPSWRWVHK